MACIHEDARDIPIAEETDVVVCGAGPAGVAAAIAAARTGARTRLLERHGCLGGIWTAGALSWIIDANDKPGLMAELIAELKRRASYVTRVEGATSFGYDVEEMKLLLEQMCAQAGIRVQLHTHVAAAAKDDSNRLTAVITESKSGREAWTAKAFVDATGDGDLAAQAGCGFDLGHPETGLTQPMSLMALVAGVRFQEVEEFVAGLGREPKERLLAEMERAGVSPSYAGPTLFRIRDELFALMANHEYGVSAIDADQITQATLRARAEVHELVNGLRSLGGRWSGLRLVVTGAQIGVREGRRIHGLYTVTLDDMLRGARHEDAVCRVNFGIDVHSTDPSESKYLDKVNRTRTQPYDIPLRALIARDVDGLLLAGRCISGDFLAHSSYRVTGDAVPMGQAAGVAAALCAINGSVPKALAWPDVRDKLDKLNSGWPAPDSPSRD